jgi:two-component system CheB/CheR fusion protein
MSANEAADSAPEIEPIAPEPRPADVPFPIVGVGASAGGLDAMNKLLGGFPADAGLAFLVVQHLHPEHQSQLPQLLGKITPLAVREATDGVRVEPNHVYIIPPNTTMRIVDGHLALGPRPPRGLNMPIDHLFRSLAGVQRSRAIGVVLSGEGTDGTLGCQAIKSEGGITFAQDEQSAKHDSMPRSAVAEGVIDYVLPPARIAR